MHYPKFTVVTPTYNQGEYIEKTIDSVLSQGYPNLEFIIIDGGSKDNTVETIKKYERHLANWVSEPDRGQSHAINKGMVMATGDYLTWLNSDDWYLPGAMNHMHELFASHPDVGMVVGAGRLVDQAGRELNYKAPTPEIDLESLFSWMQDGHFQQPSSAYTREAWQATGGINEQIHIALDLDLWIRMAKSGVKFATTEFLLSEALSHPNAKTTAFQELMVLDCCLVIIRHGGENQVRPRLEQLVNKYAWYRANYEIIVNHPILKFIRPLIKRLGKEGSFWSETVPPWVKS